MQGSVEPAERLLIDGVPAEVVPVGSWALHGATVFTTVRVEDGRPLLWDRHLARLSRHAAALGIDHPGDAALERDLDALRETGPRLLLRLTLGQGIRLAGARVHVPPPRTVYTQGVNVVVTGVRVHPDLAAYKTGSYLPFLLARREAEAVGAFEALLRDAEGHVVDGSRTSPILYRRGGLDLLAGGLEGITREAVAREAERLGLMSRRLHLGPSEIEAVGGEGQLLLAGSGVGLVPVGPPLDETIEALIARFRPG